MESCACVCYLDDLFLIVGSINHQLLFVYSADACLTMYPFMWNVMDVRADFNTWLHCCCIVFIHYACRK